MSPFQDTLIFHADFNSLLRDGRIAVSRRYASGLRKPDDRERVLLRDDEGNQYSAVVESVDGLAVHVLADLESWQPGGNVITKLVVFAAGKPDVQITGSPDAEPQPKFAVVG
jgi:hypothetical protein